MVDLGRVEEGCLSDVEKPRGKFFQCFSSFFFLSFFRVVLIIFRWRVFNSKSKFDYVVKIFFFI